MAYTLKQFEDIITELPENSFGIEDVKKKAEFTLWVSEVDAQNHVQREIRFYVLVARLLAETLNSVTKSDYQEPIMRTFISEGLKLNAKPFPGEKESEAFKSVQIKAAHVAYALQVQSMAAKEAKEIDAASAAQSDLAKAMKEFVNAQQETLKVKGTLSFNLQERLKKVGLEKLTKKAIPSEESLIKFEGRAKQAKLHDRQYVGDVDGEDLQMYFRPSFSRLPKIDAVIGSGSFEERMKGALDAKKARSDEEKVDFRSFSTFMAHVM